MDTVQKVHRATLKRARSGSSVHTCTLRLGKKRVGTHTSMYRKEARKHTYPSTYAYMHIEAY